MSDDDFLKRWSRRKQAVRRGEPVAPAPVPVAAPAVAEESTPSGEPAQAASQAPPLPPVESLTPESDFTPFMKPEVDPAVKQQALRTLFRDPRFNVMDGLDVYIDDYSKPDPLPVEWLGMMNQMKHLGEYIEKVAEAAEPEKKLPDALQEPMQDQPLATAEAAAPVDTSGREKPAAEVRESPRSGNGNP